MGEHKLDRAKSHGWIEGPPYETVPGFKARTFQKDGCVVILGLETRPGDNTNRRYWHLSISRKTNYPTWEMIKDARYALLPLGLTFAQILPPPNDYINVHPNCFHLWEIDWVTP